MSEPTAYFWKDGAVLPYYGFSGVLALPHDLRNCYSVDITCDTPNMRYGMYKKITGWVPIPFSDFPPEFRLSLLILGVS